MPGSEGDSTQADALIWNVRWTVSRSISAMSMHRTCWAALLTSTLILWPNTLVCSPMMRAASPSPGFDRSAGMMLTLEPLDSGDDSISCLTALASSSSDSRQTIDRDAPSRAKKMAADRPMPWRRGAEGRRQARCGAQQGGARAGRAHRVGAGEERNLALELAAALVLLEEGLALVVPMLELRMLGLDEHALVEPGPVLLKGDGRQVVGVGRDELAGLNELLVGRHCESREGKASRSDSAASWEGGPLEEAGSSEPARRLTAAREEGNGGAGTGGEGEGAAGGEGARGEAGAGAGDGREQQHPPPLPS